MIRIKSALGPFWRWNLNLGVGACEVDCDFCYNKRWPWAKNPWRTKALEEPKTELHFAKFKWSPGPSKQYVGPHDIMMCSTGDAFAPMNKTTAYEILRLASTYPEVGEHLRVLTKQAVFRGYGWDAPLPKKALYGTSICTLDDDISKATMPNASTAEELLNHLYVASHENLSTFISVEPMLRGMDLCDLMEKCNEFEVEHFEEIWVGRLNYGFGCEEYALSDNDIIKQVRELDHNYDIKIYVKREVKGVADLQAEGIIMREGIVYQDAEEAVQC